MSPLGQSRRVQVEQSHAVDFAAQRAREFDQRLRAALVEHLDRLAATGATPIVSPTRQVLGDQHQFTHAALGEGATLGQDLLGRAASLVAAERRDRAEPAASVTALGDLDVGPRRGGLRSRQVQEVEGRQRSRAQGDRRRRDHRRQALAESGDEVDLGQRGRELVAVALGHATGDDESGTRRPSGRPARGPSRWTPHGPLR